MNKATRKKYEDQGRRAERLAALWLRLKAYRILERRFKTPFGEIDIIATKGSILVIVEVKQRPTLALAKEALHRADLGRIEEAAHYYQAHRHKLAHKDIRYDAVYVGRGLKLKHEKDAWREC